MTEVTEANFEKLVLHSPVPVVLVVGGAGFQIDQFQLQRKNPQADEAPVPFMDLTQNLRTPIKVMSWNSNLNFFSGRFSQLLNLGLDTKVNRNEDVYGSNYIILAFINGVAIKVLAPPYYLEEVAQFLKSIAV